MNRTLLACFDKVIYVDGDDLVLQCVCVGTKIEPRAVIRDAVTRSFMPAVQQSMMMISFISTIKPQGGGARRNENTMKKQKQKYAHAVIRFKLIDELDPIDVRSNRALLQVGQPEHVFLSIHQSRPDNQARETSVRIT